MQKPIIEINNLTKVFSKSTNIADLFIRGSVKTSFTALKNVSFYVNSGESFGIVGKNGSGKTTLLKTITTLLSPSEGSISVFGFDSIKEEKQVKQRIGFVPSDERSFFWRLTCRENLLFFASLYGLSDFNKKERIRQLIEEMELQSIIDKRFDTISSGKKQLLSFARGILIDPVLLIVDEPTRSLDLETAVKIRKYLKRQVHEYGKTLLISTHQLDDIESLCDRVALLRNGSLIKIISAEPGKESFSSQIYQYFELDDTAKTGNSFTKQ